MNTHFKPIILIMLILSVTVLCAQERESDTIDGGTVTVIKPYTPKIVDAFKVKEVPNLNDSSIIKKKNIKYNIFSIPVASTFTPAKGKAASVDQEESLKLYDNYASLGVGSYLSVLGELYINHAISRSEQIGGYFSHHSSWGNLEDINFDTNFSETGLHAYYKKQQRDFYWKIRGGLELQHFNWYGLPDQDFEVFDVGHSFYTAYIGGNIHLKNAIFKNVDVLYRRFGDDQDSGENRFILKTDVTIPLADDVLQARVTVDYLGGAFENSYLTNEALSYSNINVGLKPSYRIEQGDLTLGLGVNLVYLNDIEAGDGTFFIYPNITGTYRLVDDLLVAYASIEGQLQQNSYYEFAQDNSFVSPTLLIKPTDQTYNATLGVKGKLSNTVGYALEAHYFADNNKALFKSNVAKSLDAKNYQFANSFGLIYDDLKTFTFGGTLDVDVTSNFRLGLKAKYLVYDTKKEAEAWNLPNIQGSAFLDVQINEHWFAGANLFFVGERKDVVMKLGDPVLPARATQVSLKSYFDANTHLGYKISERLSAFAKLNNLANQKYSRWINYPVQGIQFLAGATYQFDLY